METGDQQPQGTQQNTSTPPIATPTPSATTATPDKKTLMAVLAYLGILILIPFLMSKDDPFVKYHIKQGAVLFVLELIVWVVGMQVYMLMPFLGIVNLAIFVLAILGIVNAIQGKEKEVPFVGQFAKHVPV